MMSRGLLRLPLELIVGIADLLLKDETNGNPNDDEGESFPKTEISIGACLRQ